MFSTEFIRNDSSVADRKEKIGHALQKPYTLIFGQRKVKILDGNRFEKNPTVKKVHLAFKILIAPFVLLLSPIFLPIAFIGKHLVNHSATHKNAIQRWNSFGEKILSEPPSVQQVTAQDLEEGISKEELFKRSCINVQSVAKRHLAHVSKQSLDKNFNFNSLFGKVYVLSAPFPMGEKRWELFQENMKRIGLETNKDYERFEGFDMHKVDKKYIDRFNPDEPANSNKAGTIACLLAHLRFAKQMKQHFDSAKSELEKAYDTAKNASEITKPHLEKIRNAQMEVRKYSVVCLFEDNAAWGRLVNGGKEVSIKGEGYRWRKMFEKLPEDWDMINIWPGIKYRNMEKVSPYLAKAKGAVNTKGLIFHHRSYQKLIDKLEGILTSKKTHLDHVDQIYKRMQQKKELAQYVPYQSFIFREHVDSLVGCSYKGRLQRDPRWW